MASTLKFTKWNAERILQKPAVILMQYGPIIGEELKRQISTVKYEWPNSTLRFRSRLMGGKPSGNGVRIDAGARDIVDTGALLDSQTPPVVTSTPVLSSLVIKWTAPYANTVLRGGDYGEYVNPAGKIVLVGEREGRNWIKPARQQHPFIPFFIGRWRSSRA